MWCPEPIDFVENWWVEPVEVSDGVLSFVLQSQDGAERLVITVHQQQRALGVRCQRGTEWADQIWLSGLERAWFDEADGRLYASGGQTSLWIQKDPWPCFKLTQVTPSVA